MSPKVIFLDDEKDPHFITQISLKPILEEVQAELINFTCPVEFIDFMQDQEKSDKVKLVISDINMPKMTGIEVCHWLRSNGPEIQVHLATAYSSQDYKQKVKEAKAHGFLEKPLNFSVFADLISKFCRQ